MKKGVIWIWYYSVMLALGGEGVWWSGEEQGLYGYTDWVFIPALLPSV